MSNTLYISGVGTSKKSPLLFTSTLSPSATFGFGKGGMRPLNTFNSFSGSGINLDYSNSMTFAQNMTFSTGKTSDTNYNRSQRTSYFGFTALNTLSAGHYNDVRKLIFRGDGNDEFWSAGLQFDIQHKGFKVSWTNDMYYGKSNHNALYTDDKIIDGKNYDNQDDFDMKLNNAVETINITIPGRVFGENYNIPNISIGYGRTGEKAMWPSNKMHENIPDEIDKTKHFHYLKVEEPTTPVWRVDFDSNLYKQP